MVWTKDERKLECYTTVNIFIAIKKYKNVIKVFGILWKTWDMCKFGLSKSRGNKKSYKIQYTIKTYLCKKVII